MLKWLKNWIFNCVGNQIYPLNPERHFKCNYPLNQASSDWGKAQKIRKFIDNIESKITNINDNNKKQKILKWA
ncbi:MAG: hypothetical protein FH762_11730 [Firmicutes bacterium]|nr:hypothetical protein [Bacillota bacterium]